MSNTQDIQNYLSDWDNGKQIKCVNMGGLGGGYDMAIQALAMEFIRAGLDQGITTDETEESREAFKKFVDQTFDAIPENDNLKGVSGAMFGAARGMTYQFFTYGLKFMLDQADTACPDRIIYWSKPNFNTVAEKEHKDHAGRLAEGTW